MSELKLVIGNKKYSSWSLRPWLLLRHLGATFSEIRIPLYREGSPDQIRRYSPSGKVPALIDGDVTIWDTLAICEYLAESWPPGQVWPRDRQRRALARSISAEMHSGFTALRTEFPMNCLGPRRGVVASPEAQADIDRIVTIWRDCLDRFGGPWLFGSFSAADAMYAPVVIRFDTYQVPLPAKAAAYVDHVLRDAAMRDWIKAGLAETESIAGSERGELIQGQDS